MKKKPLIPFEQIVSILVIVGCFAFFFMGAFKETAESQKANISEIRSALQVILGMVVSYWFGTSDGSRKKNDTINNLKTPPAETAQ